MNKEQWQNLYDLLNQILSDFLIAYPNYKNGKNKNIRKDAERKIDNSIHLADYHIRKNWEVYELLTGGENNSPQGRTFHYDEFLSPHYFGSDLSEFLIKIRKKIESFN
jgi:hypothetical protein